MDGTDCVWAVEKWLCMRPFGVGLVWAWMFLGNPRSLRGSGHLGVPMCVCVCLPSGCSAIALRTTALMQEERVIFLLLLFGAEQTDWRSMLTAVNMLRTEATCRNKRGVVFPKAVIQVGPGERRREGGVFSRRGMPPHFHNSTEVDVRSV
ncbi:hypothetical protein TcG_08186 [Trypanosoma cruzi]|nr:hypothetical protein TcG_08186 [Trypanosoma cruzi]